MPNRSFRPTSRFRPTREEIVELYEDHSMREVAAALGCSVGYLHELMERLGVERRSISEGMKMHWEGRRG